MKKTLGFISIPAGMEINKVIYKFSGQSRLSNFNYNYIDELESIDSYEGDSKTDNLNQLEVEISSHSLVYHKNF